jgi:hypothetical protein
MAVITTLQKMLAKGKGSISRLTALLYLHRKYSFLAKGK